MPAAAPPERPPPPPPEDCCVFGAVEDVDAAPAEAPVADAEADAGMLVPVADADGEAVVDSCKKELCQR